MRLLIGLGNPGPDYREHRHNVGFWLLDRILTAQGGRFRLESKFHGEVARIQPGGQDLWLLKPQTYMNRSGLSVGAFCRYYRIPVEQILVAHDELDLPPGQVRLKQGGGHAGHNGLRDIINALGARDFWRLRIGIGHPGDRTQVVDYVLSRPSRAEQEAIDQALDEVEAALPAILGGRFQVAMNRLHRRK